MSSNVIPINRKRTFAKVDVGHEAIELRKILSAAPQAKKPVVSPLLDEVEQASTDYLVQRLKLRHQRERMERELAQAEAENESTLEAAAYFAFVNGVPESDIYNLDEYSAHALENAISKVEAQA